MAQALVKWLAERPRHLKTHLGDPQHRNAYYLLASNGVGAATGLLFWFLLAAIAGLPPAVIGLGYAIVAVGTTAGVLAKGGLDTALVRTVPTTGRVDGLRLLRFAAVLGAGGALVLCVVIAGASLFTSALPQLDGLGWLLVAGIALLLVVTWLQDAYFIGEGDAKFSFLRNVVLSAGRIALPLPVVLLAFPHPVALTWALALGFSALAAAFFARRFPAREGPPVPRLLFLRRASRNFTGSAAEFLPGLVLVPVILVVQGADAAGYFGIAWTAASLLFVASAAIGRSALSEMVRGGRSRYSEAIRKGARQHAGLLLPAALFGIVLASPIMGLFGAEYAREAAMAFRVLCASILFVAPAYLYLTVLRAEDRPTALAVFPFAMMIVLFLLVPLLTPFYGLMGVALAWLLANIPFGAYGTWRLLRHARQTDSGPGAATARGSLH